MKQGQTHTIQIHSIHNKKMQSLIRQYAVILNQGEVKKDEYVKIIRPAINHNNNNKKIPIIIIQRNGGNWPSL